MEGSTARPGRIFGVPHTCSCYATHSQSEAIIRGKMRPQNLWYFYTQVFAALELRVAQMDPYTVPGLRYK